MKCIYCSADSKLKVRSGNGGKCGYCNHPFAFEPTRDANRITDGAIQSLIKAVSGKGEAFFTDRQLWYEFNRRLLRKSFWRAPWGLFAGVCVPSGVVFGILATPVAGPIAALGAVFISIGGVATGAVMSNRIRKRSPGFIKLPFADFQKQYLHRWIDVHGPIDKLLRPDSAVQTGRSEALPPDIKLYSFDRALVTDSSEIAQMLIANRFHFENNCAILSQQGYPHEIRETVMDMLRRNPQLRVFALHDASAPGCSLPAKLREADWFPETTVRIIDLGLRPAHVWKSGMILLQAAPANLDPHVRATLSVEEAAWLEQGHTAELAGVRPARLMRAIYQGFARANQAIGGAGDDEGDVVFLGYSAWGYDGGADVVAADSFG